MPQLHALKLQARKSLVAIDSRLYKAMSLLLWYYPWFVGLRVVCEL